MHALFSIVYEVLNLYMWCFIIVAIMSWLIAFDVVNRGNPTVFRIYDFFRRITEPVLRPIQRIIPPLGGIDISPIIVYFIIRFLLTWIADNYLIIRPYP